jgi:hypothetical protein
MAMKPTADLLLSSLAVKLARHGFKYNKSRKECYERNFDNGRQGVFIHPIYHVVDFDVVMNFAIYFESLDALIDSKDSRELAKKGKNYKLYSIGIELGNYLKTGQRRWNIKSEVDVFRVADEIYQAFVEHALPYFDKYKDLQSAFDLIAGNGDRAGSNCAFNSTRSINHIGMAMLLGFDKSCIDKIVEEDTQYLNSFKAKYDLGRFLEFLEKAKNLPEWPKH